MNVILPGFQVESMNNFKTVEIYLNIVSFKNTQVQRIRAVCVKIRTLVPHLFAGHFSREGHDLAGGLIPASLLDEPGVSLEDQV